MTEINVTITEQPPIEVEITEPTGAPTIIEVPVPEVVEVEVSGPAGLTAYELAVEQGFSGTLAEWFDSLKGDQGDQGPPGPDAHYVHTQAVASDTWSVTHNLGKRPSVTVVDTSGNECWGDVEYTDVDSLIISFSAPFSGEAILN